MSTTKLNNDATTGSWEYRLRVFNKLLYVDTTDGSLSWEADDVDHYNIPASANAEGRGYSADIPSLTPDGIYIQENYNSADPAFDADVYEEKSVCVKDGEIVSSLSYHLDIDTNGQVKASNVRGTNINIMSPRRRR